MIVSSVKMNRVLFSSIICFSMFVSCRHIEVFEKSTSIPHYKWDKKYKATGTFVISDTTTEYNLYLVLRHTDSYQYNNIWLDVGLQGPGDSMFTQKIELVLSDDANGWEGTGMNDIWEVRKLVNGKPRRFIKNGVYNFSISQAMRDNPLPGILSAGLRVDAAPARN